MKHKSWHSEVPHIHVVSTGALHSHSGKGYLYTTDEAITEIVERIESLERALKLKLVRVMASMKHVKVNVSKT